MDAHFSNKDRDSAVKKNNERPKYITKVPERPLFSRGLSHKTMFFFYFAFAADALGKQQAG